jgi:protein TonB
VFVSFVVGPSGRVDSCKITRSSGNRDLDATTCRLIQRRFRYRPARDGSGKAITETVRGEQEWEVGPEPPQGYAER